MVEILTNRRFRMYRLLHPSNMAGPADTVHMHVTGWTRREAYEDMRERLEKDAADKGADIAVLKSVRRRHPLSVYLRACLGMPRHWSYDVKAELYRVRD